MTIRAREVLADCEQLLEAITTDMSASLWRPRWAGLISLLRAVGHVLDKVDGKNSPTTRSVIDLEWQRLNDSKPDPAIFWRFIDDERNNVLKLYEIGSAVNITVRPGAANLCLSTEETHSSMSGSTTVEPFMRSESFKGQDPLTLCREAIQFWKIYLDRIDRQVLEAQTSSGV